MSKVKLENKILLIILFLSLTIFSVANFLHAAWQSPAGNPYSNNDTFPFIPSVGNDNTYVLDKHLGIDNNFIVGPDTTNALYINESANRTGVLTNDPQTTLDVWGVMRIGQMEASSFPTCDSNMRGTMIYNLSQNRLNICVNGAWRRIGYDGDLDHYLDYADCNDNDSLINRGMTELCGNSIDENCDGSLTANCAICYRDADGDSYGNPAIFAYFNICPGTGDYVSNSQDCNDSNASLAVEICGDIFTNDCDDDINEECTCSANDWLSLSCPDMTVCDNNTSVTAIKISGSLCYGTAPTLICNCVCRTEHFIAPVPPICPTCRANATTLYSAKVSGITCVDSNSISDTYCSDNCTGYCNGNICCNQSDYYYCSGTRKMYHDACGVNTLEENCTYGCSGGTCNEDPCVAPSGKAACLACGYSWVDDHYCIWTR